MEQCVRWLLIQGGPRLLKAAGAHWGSSLKMLRFWVTCCSIFGVSGLMFLCSFHQWPFAPLVTAPSLPASSCLPASLPSAACLALVAVSEAGVEDVGGLDSQFTPLRQDSC